MRLAESDKLDIERSLEEIDMINMFGQFESNQMLVGQVIMSQMAQACVKSMSADPNQTTSLRHWYETFYGPRGLKLALKCNPLLKMGDINQESLQEIANAYPKKALVSLDGSIRE